MSREQREQTEIRQGGSRAEARAKAEAEEREKREWIAQRMRQEKEEEAARRKRQKQRAKNARAAKRRGAAKGLKIAAIVILCLAAILGGLGIYAAHTVSNITTNFPNVVLNGIPVGGLTREETAKKLSEQGWDDPAALTLHVKLPMDVSFDLDRGEAGLIMSCEEAAELAYRYGHGSSVVENVDDYLHARMGQVDLTAEKGEIDHEYVREKAAAAVQEFMDKTSGESFFLDEETGVMHFVKGAGTMDLDLDQLCAAAEEALAGEETELVYEQAFEEDLTMPDFDALYEELASEPEDARYAEDSFDVIPEKAGCTFDVEAAKELWTRARPMEEILIPLEILEPEVREEDLRSVLFRDSLGKQTTSYMGSSENRINNINLAAEAINGTILMPGQVFSYNDVVGERTTEKGYLKAGAYSDGRVVEQVGGGVCQVSSTLYCATLYARLEIVVRESHWFSVPYLPPGQDATVNWGSQDFQFRNNRDYPIKILASCDNDRKELTMEILGTDVDGITVTMTNEQYSLFDTEYTDVKIGTMVRLFIHYYDADGNYLETVEGLTSHYYKHDEDIDWPPEKYEKDKKKEEEEEEEPGVGDGEAVIIPEADPDGGGGDGGSGDEGGGDGGGDGGDSSAEVVTGDEEP